MPRSVLGGPFARGALVAAAGLVGLVFAACSLTTSMDGLTSDGSLGPEAGATHPSSSAADAALPDHAAPNGDAASPVDDGASNDDVVTLPPEAGGTDADPPCPGSAVRCNGACVDLTSDPANCGACGNACTSGLCGKSIVEAMAAKPALWTFNGSASWNSFAPSAMLTASAVTHQAGSAVYNHALAVDAFDVTFQFRIGLQGGTRSDGMGFMLQKNGPTGVGGDGSGLGMAGLTGFGVELDIYNGGVCGDSSDDHVGIDKLTTCSSGQPTSLASADITATLDLGDTHWHTADISLAAGALSLTIDGHALLSGTKLTGLTPGDTYYFGFAGATGGLVDSTGTGGYRQEVKNVSITFPTPRCL